MGKLFTKEEEERLFQLKRDGKSNTELGKEFNRHPESIRRYLQKNMPNYEQYTGLKQKEEFQVEIRYARLPVHASLGNSTPVIRKMLKKFYAKISNDEELSIDELNWLKGVMDP